MAEKEKTYKREFATLMVLFIFSLAAMDKVEALSILATPVFLFTGMAFGMDWGSKQTEWMKRG